MPEARHAPADLLALAFARVAEVGSAGLSRVELAREAGLPVAEVYALLPDRASLVRRLGERLDREMLAVDPAEFEGLDRRERLFELVMRRLDAMQPYRDGLARLVRDGGADPRLLLVSLCNLDRLGDWLLDAAGAGTGPAARCVAKPALLAAYARVFRVWLRDSTPDRAETMATLDRLLARIDPLLGLVGARRGTPPAPAAGGGEVPA